MISLPPMFLVLFVIGTGTLRVIQICVVVALAAVIRHLDIVVGTHGRTDFDRYVFAGVTEYLVRMSPIPVDGPGRVSLDIHLKTELCARISITVLRLSLADLLSGQTDEFDK